jgi:hypothetical protein
MQMHKKTKLGLDLWVLVMMCCASKLGCIPAFPYLLSPERAYREAETPAMRCNLDVDHRHRSNHVVAI